MTLTNRSYDVLKKFAGVWLPMIAAVIIGIGEIWNVPIMAPIGATITLIDGALGVALEKLSAEYWSENDKDN